MSLFRLPCHDPDLGGGGGDSSTPASPAPDAGGGGTAPPAAPGADASGGAGASPGDEHPEWNGELESLRRESWYAEVPEDQRARIEGGLKVKHRNWQKGYTQKFDAFSTERKTWEKEKSDLQKALDDSKRNRDYFSDLLGEDDQVAPLTEKLSGLEKSLGERDTEIGTLKEQVAKYESEARAVAAERTLARHEREFPDIFADFAEDVSEEAKADPAKAKPTGGYVRFMQIVSAGVPEEEAAKMVRAYKQAAEPPKREAEKPPKGIEHMDNGGGPRPSTATRSPNEGWDAVMARKRAEAEAEREA